ncbi:MAG: L-rhamnonate dehydratase [Candidatus Poriferisodalaceae bacterium]
MLGRGAPTSAEWHDDIDHMNPLADDEQYLGQARRFEPPWGELICVVTSDDGTWGMGMTDLAGIAGPLINDYLAPMLVGDDASDIGRLWNMMVAACSAHFGSAGPASRAISAVDLALWDLAGKVAEKPVWELIGGDSARSRSPVPSYATGLDVSAAQALGFTAFKLPCPWGPDRVEAVGRTIELVGNIRESIGNDADLMLDCWAINDVDDAIAITEAVAAFELGWVEDYIHPEDWAGYPEVRSMAPGAMLAAGERWYTDRPFEQAILEGWVDVVQPDPLWVGGATPTIRIAEMAARYDVGFALHCGANNAFGQHLSRGITNNVWAEMYLGGLVGGATDGSMMDSYRATPGMASPVDGFVTASDEPGFGIALTLDQIERATS